MSAEKGDPYESLNAKQNALLGLLRGNLYFDVAVQPPVRPPEVHDAKEKEVKVPLEQPEAPQILPDQMLFDESFQPPPPPPPVKLTREEKKILDLCARIASVNSMRVDEFFLYPTQEQRDRIKRRKKRTRVKKEENATNGHFMVGARGRRARKYIRQQGVPNSDGELIESDKESASSSSSGSSSSSRSRSRSRSPSPSPPPSRSRPAASRPVAPPPAVPRRAGPRPPVSRSSAAPRPPPLSRPVAPIDDMDAPAPPRAPADPIAVLDAALANRASSSGPAPPPRPVTVFDQMNAVAQTHNSGPRMYHDITGLADFRTFYGRFQPTQIEMSHQEFLHKHRKLFSPLAKDALATVMANIREVGKPDCLARTLTAYELCFHPRFRDRFLRWVALQVQCDTALVAHFQAPKTQKMMDNLNAQMNWHRDWFAALKEE